MKNRYYALAVEGSEADIYIFGDITSWPWLKSDVSSYNLAQEIQGLDVDVINVHINSYGGEVAEGLAIHNELLAHKAAIKTYCAGFACSAAAVVFMAGDERYMFPASALFIHAAWGSAVGNAAELHKQADDMDKISNISYNTFRAKLNISEEKLLELMNAETLLSPQEALDMGFSTAIVSEPASAKASASVRQKVYAMLMEARAVAKPEVDPEPPQEAAPPEPPALEPEQKQEPRLNKFIYALMGGKVGIEDGKP